jgi:8-oxo-dGTP pyrophosphatase MutT (NUDIX family)
MPQPAAPLIKAAVLVPIFRRVDGELRVVLVRRGARGLHGGQLAFPGGKCEAGDVSPLATALREAHEEVGIASGQAQILEHLPAIDTLTTGCQIFPFLARIPAPATWHWQAEEIAEVLEIQVRELTLPDRRGEELMEFPTWPRPQLIPFFRIGPHRLWGASYRILEPLLPRLLGGQWPV